MKKFSVDEIIEAIKNSDKSEKIENITPDGKFEVELEHLGEGGGIPDADSETAGTEIKNLPVPIPSGEDPLEKPEGEGKDLPSEEEEVGTEERPISEAEKKLFAKLLLVIIFPLLPGPGKGADGSEDPKSKVYREWDYFFPELGEEPNEAIIHNHTEAKKYKNNLIHVAYSILKQYGEFSSCINKIKIRATEIGGKFYTVRVRRTVGKENKLTIWMYNDDHKKFIEKHKYDFPESVTISENAPKLLPKS